MTADPPDIPLLEPPAPEASAIDLPALLAPHAARWPQGGESFTAVLNDPQRQTQSLAVLRAWASARGGWPRLRMVVACGTHRFSDAQRAAFERPLREAGPIETIHWHDSHADDLEPPAPASPWRVCPHLLRGTGPLLVIGSVEPHYFAGLTGAHKTCTIGCADHDAIQANHAGALADASGPLRLAGNPVFDGIAAMLAALAGRRPIVAVNLVQVADTIRAAAVGEPLATLAELSPIVRRLYCHALPAPADALVLEVQGPLGVSFYQADKAIKNSEAAVRDGGLLVLRAPCPEGIGQDHFVHLLRQAPDAAGARAWVERHGYRLGDHKALRLRCLTDPAERAVRVTAVSDGLDETHCRVLGLTKAPTVAAALAAAGLHPRRHRIYRIADAANTVVHVKGTP